MKTSTETMHKAASRVSLKPFCGKVQKQPSFFVQSLALTDSPMKESSMAVFIYFSLSQSHICHVLFFFPLIFHRLNIQRKCNVRVWWVFHETVLDIIWYSGWFLHHLCSLWKLFIRTISSSVHRIASLHCLPNVCHHCWSASSGLSQSQ